LVVAQDTRTGLSARLVYTDSEELDYLHISALEQISEAAVWHKGIALVPASDGKENPEYKNVWWRDMQHEVDGLMAAARYFAEQEVFALRRSNTAAAEYYRNYRTKAADLADGIQAGIYTGIRMHEQIMKKIILEPASYSTTHCVPPRGKPITLEQVAGEWSDQQEGEWLGHTLAASAGWSGLSNGFRDTYQISAQFLQAIAHMPASNAWEMMLADVPTSNIAATKYGLTTAERMGVPVSGQVMGEINEVLAHRLSTLTESSDRGLDMSWWWIITYPGIVPAEMGDDIALKLIEELGRGVRFKGDVYQGTNDIAINESPPFSHTPGLWKHSSDAMEAKYFAKAGNKERYDFALRRAVDSRYKGVSYEMEVGGKLRNPLPMAAGFFLQALNP